MTGLRGIAAMLVMVDHYMAVDFSTPFPWFLLPHGYIAVDMFMLLSGFVLAMRYEGRFARLPWAAAMRVFLRHRVARLYPMYALMTLVCFGLCRLGWLTFLNPDTSLPALAANLAGVQTWLWPGTSLDGPGWSISAEWAANLLFPLLLPLALGGPNWRAGAVVAVCFAILFACAFRYGTLFDVPAPGVVNIISGPQALGRCVSEFVIGLVLWRVRSRETWGRSLGGDLAQISLVVGLAVMMALPVLDLVIVAALAALVLGLAYEGSWFASVLGRGVPRWLGTISYTIYIVHIALLPLRDWLAGQFAAAGIAHSWVAAVCCAAAATVSLSAALRRWVERPAQHWLNRLGS